MRSELLLKLTRTHVDSKEGPWGDVQLTGPHDHVLLRLAQTCRQGQPLTAVTAGPLSLEERIFAMALKHLEKQGLLEGVAYTYTEGDPFPQSVDLSRARITEAGWEYEKRLG